MKILKRRRKNGFTLMELMISIAILSVIGGSMFFAMSGAFDSWEYCRDHLSIQKVLSETMDRVTAGSFRSYGLKDSLEILEASAGEVEFVPPWIDASHTVSGTKDFIYTLNRRLKPGAPSPIGEVRLAESTAWKLVPVKVIDTEEDDKTLVQVGLSMPEGSALRFNFHPDAKTEIDVARKIYRDPKTNSILLEKGGDVENVSKNIFGVEITGLTFKYFNNANAQLSNGSLEFAERQTVTGVEVTVEAKLGDRTQKLTTFVNLRNAPMRTGYVSLVRDMCVPIPDSANVKTLLVTNLSGVKSGSVLTLEAIPRAGKSWRARFDFERTGSLNPILKRVSVEYPLQHEVLSDYPRTGTDLGINLLLLGSGGLYDYDDDSEVDDIAKLEGDVALCVTGMTIKGAGLFVRP